MRRKKKQVRLTHRPKTAKHKSSKPARSIISKSVVTRQSPKKPRRVLQSKKEKTNVKQKSKASNRSQKRTSVNKRKRPHSGSSKKARPQKRKTTPLIASRKTAFKKIRIDRGAGDEVRIRKTKVLLNKRRSKKLTKKIQYALEKHAQKAFKGAGNYWAKLRFTAKGKNRWVSIKRQYLSTQSDFEDYIQDFFLNAEIMLPTYLTGQASFQVQELQVEFFD